MANRIKKIMNYWPTTWWEYVLLGATSLLIIMALHSLFTVSIGNVTVQYTEAWERYAG